MDTHASYPQASWRLCIAIMALASVASLSAHAAPGRASPVEHNRNLLAETRATAALPMAIDGYCAVTLRDSRQWRKGDPSVAAEFDGREYRFASPRERTIFMAAPEVYAPVLGGDCVVTYSAASERRPGQLQYSLLHRGRLFFFADESCLRRFIEQPKSFENADLAGGGRCPVSRLSENREVAGIPQTVATHDGIRYFFASAHHRRVFLANLEGQVANPDRRVTRPRGSQPRGADKSPPDTHRAAAPSNPAAPDGETAKEGEEVVLDSQPAMGGYCPVTIRQTGVWIRGRYDYRVEFGDLILLTAGPAEHDALLNSPLKYIPVLEGDCAATFVDDGLRVRGSIFHAVEYHDRLFLFADARRKADFKSNPDRYELADVAAGGECVVTQVEENRNVTGLAENSVWYEGQVYRFAGAEEKEKFLSTPERYMISQSPAVAQ